VDEEDEDEEEQQVNFRTLLIPVIVPLTRLADFIMQEKEQAKLAAANMASKIERTAVGHDALAHVNDDDDHDSGGGLDQTFQLGSQTRKPRKHSFMEDVAAPCGITQNSNNEMGGGGDDLAVGAHHVGSHDILDRYWEATEGGRLSDRFRLLHQARREQRLLLLLDGLDECGDPRSQAIVSAFIGGPLAREGQPMVVLATTPGGIAATKQGVSTIGENMAFQILSLRSPSPEQYRDMLTANMDKGTRSWMGTREMVNEVAALPDVIRNPYSAPLFVEWRFACGDTDFLNEYRGRRPEATFLHQDHAAYCYDIWEAPVKELQQAQIQITGELDAPRKRSEVWSEDEVVSEEEFDDASVDSDNAISEIRSWRLNQVSLLHEHVRNGVHCGMLEHDSHMLVVVPEAMDEAQLRLPGRAHMGHELGHPSFKGVADLADGAQGSTKHSRRESTLTKWGRTNQRTKEEEEVDKKITKENTRRGKLHPSSTSSLVDGTSAEDLVSRKAIINSRKSMREHGGLDLVGSPSLCLLPPAGIELLEEDKMDLLPSETHTSAAVRRNFAQGADGPLCAASARARKLSARVFDLLSRATHLSHCRRTCVITTTSEFDSDIPGPSATPKDTVGAAAAEGGSASWASCGVDGGRENGRLDGLRWKWEARQETRKVEEDKLDELQNWKVDVDELDELQKAGTKILPPMEVRWASTVDEAFHREADRIMGVELAAELKAMKQWHRPSAFAGGGEGDGGDSDVDSDVDPDVDPDVEPEELHDFVCVLQIPKKKGAQQLADEKCLKAVWEREMRLLPVGVEFGGVRDAAIIGKKQLEVRQLARALGALVRNCRLPGTKSAQILHRTSDPSVAPGSAVASWGSTEMSGLRSASLVWAHPTLQHFMAAQHIERECTLALELDDCNNHDPRVHGSAFKGVIDNLFSLHAGDTSTKLHRFGILKDAWWRPVVFMLARSSLDFERSVVTPLWQLLMEELNRRAAPALSELMWLAANACDQVVVRAFRLGNVSPSQKFYEPVEEGNVLPVHNACNSSDPNTPLILSLLEADAEMPGMLTADSMAPIHFACTLDVPIPLVVATLIKRWPDSVLEGATDSGWIPLHYLCSLERPNLVIVRLLLRANSLAATTKDVLTGKLALHLCCECASTVVPTDEEEAGSDSDHDDNEVLEAVAEKPKVKGKEAKAQPEAGADKDGPRLDVGTLVVRELLASCPSTASALDVSEKLPLHYACHRDCQSGGVVLELLKVCTPCIYAAAYAPCLVCGAPAVYYVCKLSLPPFSVPSCFPIGFPRRSTHARLTRHAPYSPRVHEEFPVTRSPQSPAGSIP
jgi:hypothetical protein